MTNWKTFIEKDEAKRNVLPPGWTSAEDIGEELGISVDRVRVRLAASIRDGTVERGVFPVFDPVTKSTRRITAFREIKKPAQTAAR